MAPENKTVMDEEMLARVRAMVAAGRLSRVVFPNGHEQVTLDGLLIEEFGPLVVRETFAVDGGRRVVVSQDAWGMA